MAETRDITITIKGENGGGNNSIDLDVSEKVDASKKASKNSNSSMAKAAFANMALQAARVVTDELISWGDYQIDKYMNLHDDYIGQRNMNVATHYINGAISAGSTIASAAMMGAAAGPWGAAIGALVGAGIAASRAIKSNIQANDQQNIQLKQLDLQLQYTRRRAGWSTHAASIGEDL